MEKRSGSSFLTLRARILTLLNLIIIVGVTHELPLRGE